MMKYPFLLSLFSTLAALLLITGCGGYAKVAEEDLEEHLAMLRSEASVAVSIFNFDRARPLYLEMRRLSEPQSEDWALGTFGAATSFWHALPPNRSNLQQAVALFSEVAELMPADSEIRARARLNLGRIAEFENFPGDRSDTAAALEHYRSVLAEFPGTRHADEAAGRIAANSLFYKNNPEQMRAAFAELRNHLEAGADPAVAPALWNFLGENYWNFLSDAASSVYAMKRTGETGAIQPSRLGILYWRIAWLAENELNDIPLAAEYYRRIYQTLPRSTRSYEARLAYERLRRDFPELAAVVPQN